MDIFSLLEKNENFQAEGPRERDDADDSLFSDDDNSGFQTPRSTEGWSPATPGSSEGWSPATPRGLEGWSPASTPRPLPSTPPRAPRPSPRTPPPKTPPRPTSRVDDRIRMRRYNLSASPSRSPKKSHGVDLPSPPRLCYRATDSSFSSNEDDWNESNDSYIHSPDVTPDNSPRKVDLLSLSPLQQRLERAKTRRQQILDERIFCIDNRSREKGQQASRRKEDATMERVSKARTEESIVQARSKRQQIHDERVQEIDARARLKEREASRRKEGVTLERVEKARSELAKSPIVKQRRDHELALRLGNIEAALESRTAEAQRRLERHLCEKQRRASRREKKDRAERRRTLISYEQRAKLLESLDARLERAALKSSRYNEEKASRAGEGVEKAKWVARRVRAARLIQGAVREVYGMETPANDLNLSQHAAARRLQLWFQWRACICKRRLFASKESTDGDPLGDPKGIEALRILVEMFSLVQISPSTSPPFEELSRRMMQPGTLRMATVIVDCLGPINEVSFGRSRAAGALSAGSGARIDGRTLLSLLLIAVHPREVLGDDLDEHLENGRRGKDVRGGRLLASRSRSLAGSLNDLLCVDAVEEHTHILNRIRSLCSRALSLFKWWKDADMEQLLAGLSRQLEQSWVVYTTSSETLKYLSEVTGRTGPSSKQEANRDDPLMSLRIRHEASRSGSRSHIKRIRLSLNKLIGVEGGKEFVRNAKKAALEEIGEADTMKDLKGEIDEIYGGLGRIAQPPELIAEEIAAAAATGEAAGGNNKAAGYDERSALPVDFPDEILSNGALVHRILLTDPADFETLTWDCTNARPPNVTPDEFMSSFVQRMTFGIERDDASRSTEVTPLRIAESMRTAFFARIAHEMGRGNCEPARGLLRELHDKMRSLLPHREDLHSHVDDGDVSACSTARDVLRVLVRSGHLLANYLESAVRAPTTRDLIGCLASLESRAQGGNASAPYGIESEEVLAVASIAYILHKAELCQADVSNYRLSQAAPLLHLVGHEYERDHFRKTFGDYGPSTTVVELRRTLPSTWDWVERMRALHGDGENLTPQSNLEQKMDFVKGRGFVDGILFTPSRLPLPELFYLDAERINHIRNEARCCVIASALALHACNISRVGASALSWSATTKEVDAAKQAVSSVLRKRHFRQDELESNVIDAVSAMTKALGERDLAEGETEALKSHTLAVLHGNDPVLKLLDNRVQGFFRFACKWMPDPAPRGGAAAPSEIKTGRSILRGDDAAAPRRAPRSTKTKFSLAAKKEATRLGFTHFGSELAEAGLEARGVITLACANFGQDILYCFLNAACEGN